MLNSVWDLPPDVSILVLYCLPTTSPICEDETRHVDRLVLEIHTVVFFKEYFFTRKAGAGYFERHRSWLWMCAVMFVWKLLVVPTCVLFCIVGPRWHCIEWTRSCLPAVQWSHACISGEILQYTDTIVLSEHADGLPVNNNRSLQLLARRLQIMLMYCWN